jgi:hypothetical protein
VRTLMAGAALCLCVWLTASDAGARPGGGSSYSGGSSGSSSDSSSSSSGSSYSSSDSSYSGSSGSGTTVELTGDAIGKGLMFAILGMIALGIAVVVADKFDSGSASQDVDLGGTLLGLSTPSKPAQTEQALEVLRGIDEAFSRVLFEDFVFALYAQAHRARHDPAALAALSPYLSDVARTSLAGRPGVVEAVVVGSLQIRSTARQGEELHVRVAFESNLHVQLADRRATHYVEETWTLWRLASAQTKPVAGTRKLGCPACGAPWKPAGGERCEACGQTVSDGRFDWRVAEIEVGREETRRHTLTGTSEEVGTDASTEFQPFVSRQWERLGADDPALTRETFEARLRLLFDTLQAAWAAQDLTSVRPFLSERQYAYMQYWVDAYKEQGLRNQVKGARLLRYVIARIDRDTHYDAVVVRFWATGFDITEDAQGFLVGGSRTDERRYSEYWTMVRSAKMRGAPRTDKTCPSCGAGLDVNQSGECAHCGTHVTSGEFDWVLSKIEQDEAYRG